MYPVKSASLIHLNLLEPSLLPDLVLIERYTLQDDVLRDQNEGGGDVGKRFYRIQNDNL